MTWNLPTILLGLAVLAVFVAIVAGGHPQTQKGRAQLQLRWQLRRVRLFRYVPPEKGLIETEKGRCKEAGLMSGFLQRPLFIQARARLRKTK